MMSMFYFKQRYGMSLVVMALLLTACSEELPPPTETVRSIRTITVAEPANGKIRRFSGIVEAATTSSLSFEVQGNVKEVKIDVGQSVTRGQVLAILDAKTYQLNVEAAEATAGRAQVELKDARRESGRLEEINSREHGLVSAQMIDQARAAYGAARKNLSYSTSRLNMAKRDLDRTVLKAPFDGVITVRNVDPFQEVNRGQMLFELHVEGVMDAAISIPESEIKHIHLGLPGEVRLPAIPGKVFRGIVTEISQAASQANAFPIKLTIERQAARVRPGLTAEVTLMLGGNDQDDRAYLVPISALVPGKGSSEYYVYVFDAASSTVKKTRFEHDGIRDNNVIVSKGLKPGDIIVVAGVSFLRDGQPVHLMEQ